MSATKVCKQCGVEKLLVLFHRDSHASDGLRLRCKACVKEYDDALKEERNKRAREQYALDPQGKIAKTRQYHLEHPEWSRERLRAHHVAHREERYERYLELGEDPEIRQRRREATRRSESRRRAVKQGVLAELISEEQYAAILQEFNGQCYICSIELGANLHWDHYQPLAHGGTHTVENIRPACDLCNIRKNACWPFSPERAQEIRMEVRALRSSLEAGKEVKRHGY